MDTKKVISERMFHREAMAQERERLRQSPELHYLFFELTDGCNLRCRHCGGSCGSRTACSLDAGAVRRTISAAAAYEPRVHIVLTGGEPLLHREFDRIVRHLGKTGVFWSLVTNATLIDPARAAFLKKNGIYSASVSLDGEEAEHNLLRQSKNAYAEALRGIELLRRNGIPIQITTVVTKRTLSRLACIEKLVRAAGADSWKLVNIEPIGRALSNRELLLDRYELLQLFDFLRSRREAARDRGERMDITYGCSHFLPLLYEEAVRETPFICGAGILIAGIRSNGDIGGCLDIERRPELIQGNLYRDDFVTVWRERYQIFRRDRTGESEQCRSCPMRRDCAGDSLHTWDFDRKRPRMCLLSDSGAL